MECKLTEKNLDKVVTDGHLSFDMGCKMGEMMGVRQEGDEEDVELLRDAVAELKLTYQH